jgi:hypothetical protein
MDCRYCQGTKTLPWHLGKQDGQPAPAGAVGKDQPGSKGGAQENPIRMHRQRQHRAGQHTGTDGELHLLHQRETFFGTR